ncbi:MAG: hypothetical protein J3Q66DRAFT_321084 [Benniella sp.]|nr:MAG: hypothetical protein J3Q66DRAFT_321084 [Benniella sp.]
MSHAALSDVKLLDLAREVLTVCSDCPLKDIIEDLTITGSSELTINRILDGQILSPLAAPPVLNVDESERSAMSISVTYSSDEENSDNDEFLRFMSGDTTIKKDVLQNRSPPITAANDRRSKVNTVAQSAGSSSASSSASNRKMNGANDHAIKREEPAVISLDAAPTRVSPPRESKILPASLAHQPSFSDWDFELVPASLQGQRPSTVMMSPPRCSTKDISKRSASPKPRDDFSLIAESSSSATRFEDDTSASVRRSKALSNATTSRIKPEPSSSSKLSTCNSSNSSSTITYALPKKTVFDDAIEDSGCRIKERILEMSESWDGVDDWDLGYAPIERDDIPSKDKGSILSDINSEHSISYDSMIPDQPLATSSKAQANPTTSERRTRGKRKSEAVSMEFENLDEDRYTPIELSKQDPIHDESISLEEEIVKRARQRRQKQPRPDSSVNEGGDAEYVDDAEVTAAPTKAELKKAEQEAKRLAREALKAEREAKKAAEKAAKELEKAAKKAAREEEQQRKLGLRERERLAKEEEKDAEKRAARELRIANRLTKTEGTKEMIVCIEASLYQSDFGIVLQDYLASIECYVNVMGTTGISASSGVSVSGIDMKSLDDPFPLQDTLFWRRIVSHRYDDEQDMFIPIPEKEVELEGFSLIYMTAHTLSSMIQQDILRSRLAVIKRDMKLRKNKERLRMSSMPQHSTIQLKEDRGQRQRVILLISGLESHFRELKKAMTKKFQQAVLADMNREAGQDNTSQSDTEKDSIVDQERIEKELLWIQLDQDCLIIQANDEEESAQVVITLTEQIGLRPYKEARRTGLNVCVEGIKPGADDRDTWIKSLQEIHRVTYQHAKSIAQEYPSIKSLYEAYRKCSNVYVAQTMLEDVPLIGRQGVVGKPISRRIYEVFMGTNPEKVVA